MSTAKKSKNGLFGLLGGKTALQLENDRLAAMLSAVPAHYCGWDADGGIFHSGGFCTLLGLGDIRHLADIQGVLASGDAATLEGMWQNLSSTGKIFDFSARSKNGGKIFRLKGTQATLPDQSGMLKLLWIEDITRETEAEKTRDTRQIQEIAKLTAAIDHLPASIWLRNNKQELIWVNETYAETLGISQSEIVAQQREISPPPKAKKKAATFTLLPGREQAAKALAEMKSQNVHAHVITTAGDRLLMNIFEIPLPQHNMTLGVARDITRQEELATELKRYKAVNQELLQQLRTAIGIYDSDQKLEFYNTAFAQLWGLDDGWLNTRPRLSDIMEKLRETRRLPEQADFRKFKQSWLSMFTNLIDPHEDMLHLPDGSALRMLVIPNPLGGMMMTFEDVTSRLELESSYNTLIAVQKETLDNLAEAVAVYGGDGRLKLWNPSFGRLWGLNPEDLEGMPHISRIVEKLKPFFDGHEWLVRREELIAHGLDRLMHEGRLERSNDTLVDFVTVPLPDGGVLITYADVTDTVRVEIALREKNAALEAAERLKLDFLANVSYQLRTPLNAIMGFNEMLDHEYFGKLNERQKSYTGDIKEASAKLLDLINDILDLSTIEAGYMTLNKAPIKIKTMLEGLVELVGGWSRKEKIEVVLSCPKAIGTLEADEVRLKQAIVNLIRNALNYTPEGGKITIAARKVKHGMEIAVSDTGIGIPKEEVSRVMEPFVRAQNMSADKAIGSRRQGAGLGLALVKNIVNLHGGNIALDSEPGKGTTVTMYFPDAQEETAKGKASLKKST